MYISHMRSEGDRHPPVDRRADRDIPPLGRARRNLPSEARRPRQLGAATTRRSARIEAARAAGLRITADMYTYTAGATGLDASMPLWVQAGGLRGLGRAAARPRDPRPRRRGDARGRAQGWENLFYGAGPGRDAARRVPQPGAAPICRPDPRRRRARARHSARGDGDGPGRRGQQPGRHHLFPDERGQCPPRRSPCPGSASARTPAASRPKACSSTPIPHPRAYGNFARLLGRYVRDERLITLAGSGAAADLAAGRQSRHPRPRRRCAPGYYADLAIFDPATIADRATFAEPHAICGRHAPRLRQRRPGPGRRRA